MRFFRGTKPQEVKCASDNRAVEYISLQTEHLKQDASNWPHLKEIFGSMYKFEFVPVVRLTVRIYHHDTKGRRIDTLWNAELDKRKSIVPAHLHARWLTNMGFPGRTYGILIPAWWTGKKWIWEHCRVVWLVTKSGHDVPIVRKTTKGWFYSRPKFNILPSSAELCFDNDRWSHPGLDIFNSRLALRRRDDGNGESVIELVFSEGTLNKMLFDTTTHDLTTLADMLTDKSKSSLRENILTRTIASLREENKDLKEEKKTPEKPA